jgi:hypothetical protein
MLVEEAMQAVELVEREEREEAGTGGEQAVERQGKGLEAASAGGELPSVAADYQVPFCSRCFYWYRRRWCRRLTWPTATGGWTSRSR